MKIPKMSASQGWFQASGTVRQEHIILPKMLVFITFYLLFLVRLLSLDCHIRGQKSISPAPMDVTTVGTTFNNTGSMATVH